MHGGDPANPMPTPPSNFPAGYRFVAWVQMKHFLFVEGNRWTFYGFIVQSIADENRFILTIRDTSNLTEWFDDLTSMVQVPLEGFGSVGYGFSRIYQTLRVVDYAATDASRAEVRPRSLEPAAHLHMKWPPLSSGVPVRSGPLLRREPKREVRPCQLK
jgi:hypothetical protein